jgi:hypothetical protein
LKNEGREKEDPNFNSATLIPVESVNCGKLPLISEMMVRLCPQDLEVEVTEQLKLNRQKKRRKLPLLRLPPPREL